MSFTFRFDSLLRLLQRRQKETELQLLQATQRMHRLHGIQQATSRAIDAMAWPESPALPAVLTQSTSAYPDKIDIVRQTTQAEIAEQESVLVRMRGELAAIRQRVIQLEQLRAEHWQRWRDRRRRQHEATRLDAVVRKHVFGGGRDESAVEPEAVAYTKRVSSGQQRSE